MLQIYACRRGARQVMRLSSWDRITEWTFLESYKKTRIISLHMPGCDSWTLSHIMPCIVWHENPTEEDSEDPT